MSPETLSRSKTASEAVIEAVSEREGVAPAELDRPLYYVIDPEALDRLVECGSRESSVRIDFTYYGYDVTVSSTGDVTVSDRQ